MRERPLIDVPSAPAPAAPIMPEPPPAVPQDLRPDGQTGEPADVVVDGPDGWQRLFPRMIRSTPEETAAAAECGLPDTTPADHLDIAWLASCFTEMSRRPVELPDGRAALHFDHFSPALVRAGIDRANLAFFQHGYVNSGIRLLRSPDGDGRWTMRVVAGELGYPAADGNFVRCRLNSEMTVADATRRYVDRRLLAGCHSGRPFNAYLLERDFRLLADDRQRWVRTLGLRLASLPSTSETQSLATLEPGAAVIAMRPIVAATAGAANDRSPSIGSIRAYAALTVLGPAGSLLDLEGGITEGALDGFASLLIDVAPRWSFRVDGNVNDAEVVDPTLRPLDIRSRGWGAEATLTYGAIRCPLTPLFGDSYGRRPRTAFARGGIERCRLGARMVGDVPVGWSAARDVEMSFTLSHRSSQSFLLGEPFSFSPGSVDGRSDVTTARLSLDWLERGRAGDGGGRGWTFAGRLRVSLGLDGSRTDIAGVAAPPPSFVVLSGQLGYSLELPWPGVVMTARLSGQWTRDLLYTAERLPIGGINSVRGYADAVLLVDRGAVGSFELSRIVNVGRDNADGFAPGRFRITAFVDGAIAENLNPASRRTDTLGSVGVGLAWLPTNSIELSAFYGRRLGPDLSGGSDALSADGIHVSITIRPLRLLGLEAQ